MANSVVLILYKASQKNLVSTFIRCNLSKDLSTQQKNKISKLFFGTNPKPIRVYTLPKKPFFFFFEVSSWYKAIKK